MTSNQLGKVQAPAFGQTIADVYLVWPLFDAETLVDLESRVASESIKQTFGRCCAKTIGEIARVV